MRRGRQVTSPITADSVDAQVVGYLQAGVAQSAMVAAFAGALRTGIPARLLPGHAVFADRQHVTLVNQRRDNLETWRRLLDEATARVKRARAFALDPNSTEQEAADFRDLARKAEVEAETAREEIEKLETEPEPRHNDVAFDVYTDAWFPALTALGAGTPRLSQEAIVAFNQLVPTMRFEFDRGQWWGVATLRVNTSEGAMELGPIRWAAGRGGSASPLLALNIPRAVTGRGSRKALLAELERAGVTPEAAATVGNSVFSELSEVLLHGMLGAAAGPWPDWVGPQWRDPLFVAWIVKVYGNPNFVWMGQGKYAHADPNRQLAVSFAASVHERDVAAGVTPGRRGWFRAQELSRATPVDVLALIHNFVTAVTYGKSKIRRHQPILEVKVDGHQIAARWFAPFTCLCGAAATLHVRVPEIPRDLLCACGRMLDAAAWGMDPQMRFPDEYQQLRLTDQMCLDLLYADQSSDGLLRPSRTRSSTDGLTARHRNILRVLARPTSNGLTMDDLVELAKLPRGRGTGLTRPMQQLEAIDVVTGEGRHPIRFFITDRGRDVVEGLSPDLEPVVARQRTRPATPAPDPIIDGGRGDALEH